MNVVVRIVCINGKHKVYFAELDSDGAVERLLDEVELVCNGTAGEFISLLNAVVEAKSHPIVVVNACNKRMLLGGY